MLEPMLTTPCVKVPEQPEDVGVGVGVVPPVVGVGVVPPPPPEVKTRT